MKAFDLVSMCHIKDYITLLIREDETLTYGQQANLRETINANEEIIINGLKEIVEKIKERL